MIINLSIKNYAIIAQSGIQFYPGFSVITGETGAGKSILLDALSLILGQRADLKSLRDKEKKCIIEATFDISGYDLKSFFISNDLDYESQTIIRREILPSGKSRAFINDSPTQLSVLQQLGKLLIDIHSQHQTLELFDDDYFLEVLDIYADAIDEKKSYKESLKIYATAKKALDEAKQLQTDLLKEHDYQLYLFQELDKLQLADKDEEDLLAEEERSLANVEKITENLSKTHQILSNDEYGVLTQLNDAKNQLSELSSTQEIFGEWYERLQSTIIEINDITAEVEERLENTIANPQRLDEVQNRLQMFQQLYKKHQVNNLEHLMQLRDELAEKIEQSNTIEDQIKTLEKDLEIKQQEVEKQSTALSEKRQAKVLDLQALLEKCIQPLGMPNARFQIILSKASQFLKNGQDTIQITFSANKGIDFGPMKKNASGGELSRIMLVIKSILAEKSHLSTLIFDEIDTGVSGDIANKMAEIMREMSKNMQVFAVTHLPQVAASGEKHYKVYKKDVDEKTTSEIVLLDENQRVEEIAQMLSGSSISEAAINQARELITKN